jgi:hypothetical protein
MLLNLTIFFFVEKGHFLDYFSLFGSYPHWGETLKITHGLGIINFLTLPN